MPRRDAGCFVCCEGEWIDKYSKKEYNGIN